MNEYINKIIQGDCLEVMRGMPDKSVDLILTDPPYGLNSRMKGGTWGVNTIYKEMLNWDNLIGKEYFDEMFRVSKNQIIWGEIIIQCLHRDVGFLGLRRKEWIP